MPSWNRGNYESLKFQIHPPANATRGTVVGFPHSVLRRCSGALCICTSLKEPQIGLDIPAQSRGECREAPAGLQEPAGEASVLINLEVRKARSFHQYLPIAGENFKYQEVIRSKLLL